MTSTSRWERLVEDDEEEGRRRRFSGGGGVGDRDLDRERDLDRDQYCGLDDRRRWWPCFGDEERELPRW